MHLFFLNLSRRKLIFSRAMGWLPALFSGSNYIWNTLKWCSFPFMAHALQIDDVRHSLFILLHQFLLIGSLLQVRIELGQSAVLCILTFGKVI